MRIAVRGYSVRNVQCWICVTVLGMCNAEFLLRCYNSNAEKKEVLVLLGGPVLD